MFFKEIMEINIAICDNSRAVCNDLTRLIRAQKPAAKVFTFTSAETFLAAPEDFAIVFLDIKGIAGLDVAKILRAKNPAAILIFVTGYREYMPAAFDVRAFHYILKPVDAAKFAQILDRAFAELDAAAADKFIVLKTDGVTKKFFLRDIFFIESANKKVIVHSATGTFAATATMDALEIALAENFYRCHRCYLVNLEKISAYTSDTVTLTSGAEILIAAKKFPDFVKTFLHYARTGGGVNV